MSWQRVRLDDIAPTPWRNGGGLTRELLAWPRADEWRVRISVAEVTQDGPFSSFPSIQRWFAVLGGEGVRLTIGGVEHALTTQSAPLQFSGAEKTDCCLVDGSTRDFNLMLRAGSAKVERIHQGTHRFCQSGTLVAAYANTAGATVRCDGAGVEFPAHTLGWCVLPAALRIEINGPDALWMEITA